MPIDPRAIKKFLERTPPLLPQFKGAPTEKLHKIIYNCTGAWYRPKTPPRQLQLEGLAKALYLRRGLMIFDMRLGKTKMSLDWAAHLRRANLWRSKGLVIAHSPLGLSVWEHQVRLHSDLKLCCVQNASDAFVAALESDCDLIAIPWTGLQNIFSVKRRNRKGTISRYADMETIKLAAGAFELCIIDEIHLGKNPFGLWWQIAHPLVAECKFRMGLTGTPVGGDPYSIWAQSALVDDGKTFGYNYFFFEQAFGVKKKHFWTGKAEWKFDKTKLPLLKSRLDEMGMTYMRHEVREIKVLRGTVELRMGDEQRDAYNELADQIKQYHANELEKIENTFIRMRQIASGWRPFIDEEGVERIVEFAAPSKLEWMQELVENLTPDIQLVIFHEYIHSGKLICQRLEKAKIKHGWLRGATKDKAGVVRAFAEKQTQVLVANTATGALGVDMVNADYLCFFESSCSPIIRAQAEARPLADARGDRPLMLDDLVCSPVEQRILGFIHDGKNLMAELTRVRSTLFAK